MKTDRWAYESLEVYVWEGKSDIADRVSRFLSPLGVDVIRAGALEALPGVGRKTANVVLNEAFGHPTIAVDTHIFRVGNRTGMAPGKTPDAVEAELLRRVPDKWKKGAHHWLILHGRYICKARKPDCADCVIIEFCRFKEKTA